MDQPGITPRTLTLVLAYLHREVVRWLPGRGMAAGHLQALALWIGQPAADLRTVRAHRLLAGHLAVLRAAGLLQVTGGYWHPTAAAFAWLRADTDAQLAWLLRLLPDSLRWAETVAAMALDETLPLDAAAFLQQTLARQMGQGEQAACLGQWVGAESGTRTWQIALPERLAPLVLFHLLQFGDWQPGEWWRCTPLTVAAAGARGYTPLQIELWLGSATGQPVDVERQKELLAWWDEAGAYQVQQVMLLSTRQPSQLAEIAGNRRLYRQFHRQISPRHAVVAPALGNLRKFIADSGFTLESAELAEWMDFLFEKQKTARIEAAQDLRGVLVLEADFHDAPNGGAIYGCVDEPLAFLRHDRDLWNEKHLVTTLGDDLHLGEVSRPRVGRIVVDLHRHFDRAGVGVDDRADERDPTLQRRAAAVEDEVDALVRSEAAELFGRHVDAREERVHVREHEEWIARAHRTSDVGLSPDDLSGERRGDVRIGQLEPSEF